jgi:RNA polymerase sigma-70 factor, ECF subfamily
MMDTDSSDEELVVRYVTQRDEPAFTELVTRYREPVFRLALSILGPGFSGEAEEVAQEVFLRVHASLKSFRREAKFSSWLYRITFNQALNVKARVRYRAPHLSFSSEALPEMIAPDGNPHDTVQDLGRNQALAECIAQLPEVYQSALRLHYWLGHTVTEIAVLLGVPENTVKSYLHRARRLLQTLLEKRGYSEDGTN